MIEYIPEMIAAGIDSFKIEGRMKTALYVATVTRTYRQAIDDYLQSEELYRNRLEDYRRDISACTYRQFTTGFYFGKPDETTQIYDSNTYITNYVYLGTIEDVLYRDTDGNLIQACGGTCEKIYDETCEESLLMVHQKNKFCIGDEICVLEFNGNDKKVKVMGIFDEKMMPMESAPHPKQLLYIQVNDAKGIKKGMVIRSEHCEV